MDSRKNVLVTGTSEYRIKEPYSKIQSDINFTLQNNLTNAFDYDAIVLQCPIADGIRDFIVDFQELGKKVIIDMDDDVFYMHPENPAYGFATPKNLLKLKEHLFLCDYIHCSTPQLLASLNHHRKSVVFHNGIDFDKYKNLSQDATYTIRKNLNIPFEKRIVMWAGSPSHYESVHLIVALAKELSKRSDIAVVLCSNIDWIQSYFDEDYDIKFVDFMPFDAYTKLLSIADIALCPLPNNRYNRSKSELKILENTMHKTPCIASSADPYIRFKTRSGNGVRIITKERLPLWMKEINLLLSDDNVYRTTVENAYSTTKEHYNLETINKDRNQWWKKMLT